MRRRFLVLVVAAAAVAMSLVGCTSSGGSSEGLTVYSGRNQELIEPLIEQFTRRRASTSTSATATPPTSPCSSTRRVTTAPADVFLSQSPGARSAISTARIASARSTRERARPRARNASGPTTGTGSASPGGSGRSCTTPNSSTRPTCPRRCSTSPTRSTSGKVAVAPTNGSFQDFVTTMRELVG